MVFNTTAKSLSLNQSWRFSVFEHCFLEKHKENELTVKCQLLSVQTQFGVLYATLWLLVNNNFLLFSHSLIAFVIACTCSSLWSLVAGCSHM